MMLYSTLGKIVMSIRGVPGFPSLVALPDGDHPKCNSAEAEDDCYDDLREGGGRGRLHNIVSLARNLDEAPIDGRVRVRGHGLRKAEL